MGRIEMDLQKANSQAAQLERIAQRLYSLSYSKMDAVINDIGSNWDGVNAKSFCTKGRRLSHEVATSATNLRRIAEHIRIVARNTYEAEKRAEEIARERNYKK